VSERARTLVALSPGSRSTPLVLALAERSDLELIDVIDERSAAFFALGHARVTNRFAVVVATSGTAPAHWYPAVIEASEAGIPLVLLSADRPTELMHCGAAQTIDQRRLFGEHVRFFADLGDPHPSPAWLRHVDRTIATAIDHATGDRPGPVHVNVRARKPLERSEPMDATDRMAEHVARALTTGLRIAARTSSIAPSELDRVAARIAQAERPLVLVGPLPVGTDVGPIGELAERLGAPLVAEWGSQLKGRADVLTTFDLLLEVGDVEARAPDLVLQIGGAPTASVYERWTTDRSDARLTRVMIGRSIADAAGTADELLLSEPSSVCRALLDRLARRGRWDGALRERHRAAERAIASALEERDVLAEGACVRAAIEALPSEGNLVLGNSLPIRLAERFAPSGRAHAVVVQRGVNGIDGMIAGSLGTITARPEPTLAVLGDVTVLHDIGSLALVKRLDVPAPLVFLILDNGGGRIFEQLPIGRRRDLAHAMPHFITEHHVDLVAVARAFGISAQRVDTSLALEAALGAAFQAIGPHVIVAQVPPHDARDREARIQARLNAVGSGSA
jgi:2-succinyl-5-enolpyruvyl-6-hydroxy-3-cyclohexene-1-carboxylate synthase